MQRIGHLGANVYRSVLKFGMWSMAALAISGCVLFDDTRRLGPDEFGVVSRAPLSQPPDFALRPPRSGEKRPNEVTPREQARNELLATSTSVSLPKISTPNANPTETLSPGEQAVLQQAGALEADSEIRVIVDRESGRVKEDKSLVDKLVFWSGGKNKPKVVDPKAESARLNREAATGAPTPQSGASQNLTGK